VERRRHALGAITITSSDRHARVLYIVFPSHADAVAAFETMATIKWLGMQSYKVTGDVTIPSSLPRLAWASHAVSKERDVHGRSVTIGQTVVLFVDDNVIGITDVGSLSTGLRADAPRALALAEFALAHLRAARQPSIA
jgi:hypothetical protein